MEQEQSSLFQMNIDAQNSFALRSAASWAKVLGVVSIILGIIFIIIAIMVQQALNEYSGYRSYQSRSLRASGFAFFGVTFYALVGIACITGGVFGLNTSNRISTGLNTNNINQLNSGFAAARNLFALWAIVIIVLLLIILLGIMNNL